VAPEAKRSKWACRALPRPLGNLGRVELPPGGATYYDAMTIRFSSCD
jgi:hypothetical protein